MSSLRHHLFVTIVETVLKRLQLLFAPAILGTFRCNFSGLVVSVVASLVEFTLLARTKRIRRVLVVVALANELLN